MDGLFPSSTKKPTKLEVTEIRKQLSLGENTSNTTKANEKISSNVPSKKFSSTIKSDSVSASNKLAMPMKKIDIPSVTDENMNELDEDVAENKEESEEDDTEENAKPSKSYGLAYLGRLFNWFKK